MNKKEIYEHLARIYLDASLRHKNKKFVLFDNKINLFIILSLLVIIILPYIFFIPKLHISKTLSLVLLPEKAKINFHSSSAKKEALTFNLDNLNLERFRKLSFLARKADVKDIISLRIEFRSKYNEVSALYIKDIDYNWRKYEIELSKFREITDWNRVKNLSFIIEEWNTKNEKNIVYLDEVKLEK